MALWTSSAAVNDDDFFGTDGDDCAADHHPDTMAVQDAAAASEQYKTLGYHETYDSSLEAALQDGFVLGYRETYTTATRLGSMLGQIAISQKLRVPMSKNPSQNAFGSATTTGGEDQIGDRDCACILTIGRIRQVLESFNTESGNQIYPAAPSLSNAYPSSTVEGPLTKLVDLENEMKILLNVDD